MPARPRRYLAGGAPLLDHSDWLTAIVLTMAGLQPYEIIMRLNCRFLCRECDAQGHGDISSRSAE
jgi:hypothetical protein